MPAQLNIYVRDQIDRVFKEEDVAVREKLVAGMVIVVRHGHAPADLQTQSIDVSNEKLVRMVDGARHMDVRAADGSLHTVESITALIVANRDDKPDPEADAS